MKMARPEPSTVIGPMKSRSPVCTSVRRFS